MKKTYLFDFDGTLVDSMPTYASVMLRILDENGAYYPPDVIKIITPLGSFGTVKYFQSCGVKLTVEQILLDMGKYLLYEYENNIVTKEGVIDTLHVMKEKGYSLNVLTASPHVTLDPCLKRNGIWELFDNVWSCDDFNTTKANPEIYKMASSRLGRSVDEVVFVDDNINAVKTAKAAGMISCGIFDPSSEEYVEEMKKAADRYVYSFPELLNE